MQTDDSATARLTAERGMAALARLGLPADDPEIVSNRGSLMVRMPRAGVVARVSTHTGAHRVDPGWWLTTEVTVGRLAHAAGAPVVPPAQHPPAGPHEVDGLWVSVWTDVGGGGGIRPAPEETAAALAHWHQALAGGPGSRAAAPRRSCSTVTPTGATCCAPPRATGCGTTSRMPVAARSSGISRCSPAPLRTRSGSGRWPPYGAATGRAVPSAADLAPRLRDPEGNAWALGCAVSFPERYAASARAYVDALVARRAAGR